MRAQRAVYVFIYQPSFYHLVSELGRVFFLPSFFLYNRGRSSRLIVIIIIIIAVETACLPARTLSGRARAPAPADRRSHGLNVFFFSSPRKMIHLDTLVSRRSGDKLRSIRQCKINLERPRLTVVGRPVTTAADAAARTAGDHAYTRVDRAGT